MKDDVERLTRALFAAMERKDLAAVAELLDPHATFGHPLSLTGEREAAVRWVGKERVLGYVQGAFAMMGRIRFDNVRVSVTADGKTSFVQADGDFTTLDGRPYCNVYIFRNDWHDGRAVSIEEYASPLTFLNTFGQPSSTCSGPRQVRRGPER